MNPKKGIKGISPLFLITRRQVWIIPPWQHRKPDNPTAGWADAGQFSFIPNYTEPNTRSILCIANTYSKYKIAVLKKAREHCPSEVPPHDDSTKSSRYVIVFPVAP